MKLLINAAVKFIIGLLMVGVLIFLPAGTLAYANGWLFYALLFIPMLILGIVLFFKDPALLERRLGAKEKDDTQKKVVAASGLLFVLGFTVAGLDFRFGLSSVPKWAVAAASVLLLTSYAAYAEVMRENAYLSRTVQVSEGQTVVDTGLYGVVRHPMYAATLGLFLSIPVVLGSWWALIPFALYVPLIVVRAVNEEKLLLRELDGYGRYMEKVKYRLIPFVW